MIEIERRDHFSLVIIYEDGWYIKIKFKPQDFESGTS